MTSTNWAINMWRPRARSQLCEVTCENCKCRWWWRCYMAMATTMNGESDGDDDAQMSVLGLGVWGW
eukprot:3513801-Alexandrium_andersonii.AAC.1